MALLTAPVSSGTGLVRSRRVSRRTRVRRGVVRALSWTVILGISAVLAVAVAIPRLTGATPYAILTGSMTPTLPVGTLVVVRPVTPDQIGIGRVITYQLHSGEPEVATHRVVAMTFDRDGSPLWRVQGDANNTPDADWVRPVQVKGAVWYSVPRLGQLTNLITPDQRQLATYLVAAALFGYAIRQWAGSAAGAVRRRREAPGP